jgi:hypothetical protein
VGVPFNVRHISYNRADYLLSDDVR